MSDSFGEAADTAMEHAGADAAAGLGAAKGKPAGTHCLNCGAPLAGDFCHQCGQSAQSLRQPFWALLAESVETLFSLDSRAARTLPGLLLQPGKVTRAYLDGRRARFIPPFRLYVLASLVFFVLLPLVMGQGFSIVPGGMQNFDEARAQVESAYAAGNMTEEEYQGAVAGIAEAENLWRSGPAIFIPDIPKAPGAEETPPAEPSETPEWVGFMPKEALDAVREVGEGGDERAARFVDRMENVGELE